MGGLLYAIGAILVALWIAGFVFANMGGLIHLLLVLAVVAFLYQAFTGRTAV